MSVAGIHLDGRRVPARVPQRVPQRVPLRDPVAERSLGVSERVASLARSWTPRHAAGSRTVRLDTIDVTSAAPYLAVWASVLCVVQLVVYTFGYFVLYVLGVINSLSHSLALVLGSSVPKSGVLPALAPSTVLFVITVLSIVLSGLAFLAGCSLVMIHNVACHLTGGVRVRMRASAMAPESSATAALGWPATPLPQQSDASPG